MKLIEKPLLFWILTSYLLFPVVFPNSFREIALPGFVLVGVLSACVAIKRIERFAVVYILLVNAVTIFYLLLSYNDAAEGSFVWIFFVYMVSPVVWLLLLFYLLDQGIERFVGALAVYGVIASCTVFLFIFMFTTFGPSSVGFFIDQSNVEFSDGRVAVTMHVYGSLIFIATAFIAMPKPIFSKHLHYGLLFLLILAAIFSGRSALQLAVVLGVILNLIFSSYRLSSRLLVLCFVFILVLFVAPHVVSFLSSGSNLSPFAILGDLIDKIVSGGGDERVRQYGALVSGAFEHFLLGAGHGVPAAVIRNDASPWKYELLWLSTLYHVGIFGFLIYAVPFLLSVYCFVRLKMTRQMNEFDVFMFSGMISVAVASNTNPYIQSFDFQWMYVAPAVYFCKRWRECGWNSD